MNGNLKIENKSWRLLTVLVFLVFIHSNVSAQQFRAGITAGLATSQVDGDTWGGYNKLGLTGAVFLVKKFKESKWSASFEIRYTQKGSKKLPRPDKGDFAEYRLYMDYAEVPLLLHYDMGLTDTSGKALRIQLEGGISAGAMVRAKEFDQFGQITGGTPFEKMSFDWVAGGTLRLSERWGFNVRTGYSILPVRKGGTTAYYYNWTHKFLKPGYYHNYILFSLRYGF